MANEQGGSLVDFVDALCGSEHYRIEQDFGGGYVRLRSTEAERRQAAQDIRSTEDIVIELLRNARDAGARTIFVALQRDDTLRTLVVIDDGCGVPPDMRELVFEPRVTSKLDSAHMDKWGMHGRGMALFSVRANAKKALVKASAPGGGTSLLVQTDLTRLPEKSDQSSFPHFEAGSHALSMRGPKNILRTVAEFALEHRRDCTVFCGSFTEVASTLYAFGMSVLSPAMRAFATDDDSIPLVHRLATAVDPDGFAVLAESMGLELSSRSARRIMDGTIEPLPSMMERLEAEAFPHPKQPARPKPARSGAAERRSLKLAPEDMRELQDDIAKALGKLSDRYFIRCAEPEVQVGSTAIRISVPLELD